MPLSLHPDQAAWGLSRGGGAAQRTAPRRGETAGRAEEPPRPRFARHSAGKGFGFDQGTRGKIAESGETTTLTAVHPPQLAITTPKPRQIGHDSGHDPQFGNITPILRLLPNVA